MIFDMHTHTNLSSCSVLTCDEMLETAKAIGLDGICITDHRTMDIRHQLDEGLQKNGIVVIFGMEYDTADGDFLIFGPYEEIPQGMSAKALLQHVRATKGVAVAAHPFRGNRLVSEALLLEKHFHIVESINGRSSDIENLKINRWLKGFQLTEVGGSDAHMPDELGKAVTRFSVSVHSRKDLIYALQHGLCRPEAPLYMT